MGLLVNVGAAIQEQMAFIHFHYFQDRIREFAKRQCMKEV